MNLSTLARAALIAVLLAVMFGLSAVHTPAVYTEIWNPRP